MKRAVRPLPPATPRMVSDPAMFSIEMATTPSVAKNAAWRSRGITCVLIGSGTSPSLSQTCDSTPGSILAKVPTAPEILPTFSRAVV
mgnify:CR=1 FL=1